MSWKLLTETDLDTGEKLRYFQYEGKEGSLVVPEGLAIDLLQRLVSTFPTILDGLRATAPKTAAAASPPAREPTPSPLFHEEDEEEEEVSTPLKIPDQIPAEAVQPVGKGGGEFTLLSRFAPEKDAPQG
jgi:hypothetical protein